MTSVYMDVMLSNAKVATVSVRQLQIEHWVYEIQIPGEPTQRGTVEWLGKGAGTDQPFSVGTHMLSLVAAVLNDYAEAIAASQASSSPKKSIPQHHP